MLLPPVVALVGLPVVVYREWRRRRQGMTYEDATLGASRLVLLGLLWVPVAYFPHSNIPTLLPTVRAERFWVIPAMGAAFVLGALLYRIVRMQPGRWRSMLLSVAGLGLAFQAVQARRHAIDYTDDLSFWRATARATPNSAKARLNHAVMLGARQRLPERLAEGAHAIRLAPKWPMAHIYQGDTLCRMERPDEAWPHYRNGFELGPNEQNLIALALQCL
jgi:tetratricopeptide (TPR) repeat protein